MANLNRRGIPMPFVSRTRRIDPPSPVAPQAPLGEQAGRRNSMVDSAIYAHGVRVASPTTLAETYSALDRTPGGVVTTSFALVIAAAAVVATFLVDPVAALWTFAAFAAFMVYFGLYSRNHLVANSPDEEFAALAKAEEELG